MKKMNLQLFADGAGAGTGAEGTGAAMSDAGSTGENEPTIVYGKESDPKDNSEQAQAPKETRKTFEELIKGDYKEDFDSKVSKIIGKKTAELKGLRENSERVNPILDLIAQRYGVDSNDYDSIISAIESDNHYYEEEAIEKGMSVEQLRQMRRIERENAELKRSIEESRKQSESEKIYNQWIDQAEAMKEIYPSFDFMTECENNDFSSLLRNGIDVKTAYEVIHKDEIIQGAMAVTAQKVKEGITNDIRANGNRATENGTASQSAIVHKRSVSELTKADRKEIERRVARGERITF